MQNLPLVVHAAASHDSQAASCGKTERKTVERLIAVSELLVSAVEADGAAVWSPLNPDAEARRTLCWNLQEICRERVSDMRVLLKFFFDAWNHHALLPWTWARSPNAP